MKFFNSFSSALNLQTPEGKAFRIEFYKKKKSPYYQMELNIDFPGETDFLLRFEQGFDRFAKSIGLSKEIQSGNKGFDDLFYISADDDQAVETIFKDKSVIELLNSIFAQGARQLSYDAKGLSITWGNLTTNNPSQIFPTGESDPRCIELVNTLYLIKNKVSEIVKNSSSGFILKSKKISNNMLVFSFVMVFTFLAIALFSVASSSYPALHSNEALSNSLKLSVPLFFGLTFIVYQLIKGHSKSHLYFIPFILFLLLDSIFSSVGAWQILNAKLDHSPVTSHVSIVRDKYSTKSKKGSRKYYIKYDSWDTPQELSKISVRSSEYDSIIPGKTKLYLDTKKGALGLEWIVRKWLQ